MANYKDSTSTTTDERRGAAQRGHQLFATSAFADGEEMSQSQPFHYVAVYLHKRLVGGYGQIYDALTRGSNNESLCLRRGV
jgi:hypothetical protein